MHFLTKLGKPNVTKTDEFLGDTSRFLNECANAGRSKKSAQYVAIDNRMDFKGAKVPP